MVEGGGSSCLKGVGFTVLATDAGCGLELNDVFLAVVIFIVALLFVSCEGVGLQSCKERGRHRLVLTITLYQRDNGIL